MTRKYNPGHYVALMRRYDDLTVLDSVAASGLPRGIQKRYAWRTLEPRRGCFDFSEVMTDLDRCASLGMQLMVYFEDKTFVPEHAVPEYLNHLSMPNRGNGYTAIRWHPHIVERQQAVFQRLGQYVDGHPAFEGIGIEETSLSLDDTTLNTFEYSPEGYRDALISHIVHASRAFPTSYFFWHMNFIARQNDGAYISQIVSECAPLENLIMGGPDVLPNNDALVKRAYPLYDKHQGDVRLFIQVSPGSMNDPGLTAQTAFEFARDRLHVDYVFWHNFNGTAFRYVDVMDVMRANPFYGRLMA
jgi:hypothetical protein